MRFRIGNIYVCLGTREPPRVPNKVIAEGTLGLPPRSTFDHLISTHRFSKIGLIIRRRFFGLFRIAYRPRKGLETYASWEEMTRAESAP
jgi:hypothetical protein